MLKECWVSLLSWVYKFLIIRVHTLNKDEITGYEKLKTFSTASVDSNLGPFVFSFKEDRRSIPREKGRLMMQVASYFAELKCPEGVKDQDNIFHQKVILVVKLRVAKVNYEALGRTLLHTYLSSFEGSAK